MMACVGGFSTGMIPWSSRLAVAQATGEAVIGAERLSEAFRDTARKLRPSVVTISAIVERPILQRRGGAEFFGPAGMLDMEELLRELQRQQRGGNRPSPQQEDVPTEKLEAGMGSGVIVSQDGYVLTNNHVIAQADELQIELSDGRVFTAEVVGTDDKSDVALLKIDATGLVAAALGDSSAMQVGDWVVAIGSPFGLDQTVTAGIVSATNRTTGILSSSQGYEDFLQTDAAINPGNSGGPLVNLRGEVIGINTAINSRTGTNAGVGFAIPSNMAERIMEDLRTKGRVIRGFIGAYLDNVTAENASELALPPGVRRGAAIVRVLKGGPADKAGVQVHDVITGVEGRAVASDAQLRNIVALTRPGTALTLELYRDGQPMRLPVVLEEKTEAGMNALIGRVTIESLDIIVESFTAQEARRIGLDAEDGSVVITEMNRAGDGFAIGLRPADILIEVDGQAVTDPKTAAELLAKPQADIRILVQRRNRLIMLP